MNMQNPVPTSAFNAYRNWEWFPVAENAQSPREVFRLQRAASSGMVASALAFEAAMFRLRSRYLMLFVTLNYRDELHYQVSLETLQQDRDHLFNNTRSNHMLRGIFGYMWRVEYGEAGGGWHLHLVVFYDGSHQRDIYYAQEIGEYWVNVVTNGRGDYWNSNADKDKFAVGAWGDATGQVNRRDIPKRTSLRKYLAYYFCKDDQQVEEYSGCRFKSFGKSIVSS